VYEVEVKVATPHGPVRGRLDALPTTRLGVVDQRDTYYDHPVRSFAETDEALRLRRESTTGDGRTADPDDVPEPTDATTVATLTYKGPLVDDVSKTREEIETVVEDPASADAILRSLGFEPVATVEKERERFAIEGYTVTLDAVAGLGEFVEVEAGGDESAVEALRDGAFELVRRLGLDPADTIRTSYLELLLAGRESAGGT